MNKKSKKKQRTNSQINSENLKLYSSYLLEKGKISLNNFASKFPDTVTQDVKYGIEWIKKNPIKATVIGATGALSLRSHLIRSIAKFGLTSVTSAAIKSRIEKS